MLSMKISPPQSVTAPWYVCCLIRAAGLNFGWSRIQENDYIDNNEGAKLNYEYLLGDKSHRHVVIKK
ncbi:hypothetical protein GCM10010912_67690 [Paenibacillus albidus]|uniref:Uncharacterized protein n=1 Tax=Paenibacillus albidus TaxID=2041023 RepID=A0A917D852_9BACL|nr:hypothetical protein GCM10010912_67690 [Paenibacillus albidus]